MKKETQDVLNALQQGGIDVSSIYNQIRSNPLAERTADSIVGGGILRQRDYQRYMNELQERENTIRQSANELATLHDAKNMGASLAQSTLDRIKFLEDKLIELGDFDEESVRNLSKNEKSQLEVIKTGQGNANLNTNQNRNTGQNLNQNNGNRSVSVEGFTPSDFVDLGTHQASLANIAYGAIATNLEINAALDEVRGLGITVDRASIKKFQDNLKTGFDRGKGLDDIVEETFNLNQVREAKQKETHEKEIEAAIAKGRAETLKELGVPAPNRLGNRRHVIFDRNKKSSVNGNNVQVQGNNDAGQGTGQNEEGQQNLNVGEIPVNKYNDREVFRSRGTREQRLSRAIERSDQVHEYLENDPTFID